MISLECLQHEMLAIFERCRRESCLSDGLFMFSLEALADEMWATTLSLARNGAAEEGA